jgi:hypothetical protein
VLASTVIAVAVTVLVGGWALDVAVLRSVLPGAVGMKAMTALGLICAGASLLLLRPPGAGVRRRVAGIAAGLIPGIIGVLVLAEYVFGWSLGIDELGFVDHTARAHGATYPGRLAPATAVCFVLISVMVALLEVPPRRGWRPTELVAVPLAVVTLMSLVGYAYSITVFYGSASAAQMAVNTAVCFVMLVVGFALVRPHGRLLRLATTTDPGGVIIRRLAPLVLTVPFGLGWLHLRTVQWGVFDEEVAAWWRSAS